MDVGTGRPSSSPALAEPGEFPYFTGKGREKGPGPVKSLKRDAPSRGVQDVGPGDFVKIGQTWKEISTNSAEGSERLPRSWSIGTTDGGSYSMWDVARYAKREDLDG